MRRSKRGFTVFSRLFVFTRVVQEMNSKFFLATHGGMHRSERNIHHRLSPFFFHTRFSGDSVAKGGGDHDPVLLACGTGETSHRHPAGHVQDQADASWGIKRRASGRRNQLYKTAHTKTNLQQTEYITRTPSVVLRRLLSVRKFPSVLIPLGLQRKKNEKRRIKTDDYRISHTAVQPALLLIVQGGGVVVFSRTPTLRNSGARGWHS